MAKPRPEIQIAYKEIHMHIEKLVEISPRRFEQLPVKYNGDYYDCYDRAEVRDDTKRDVNIKVGYKMGDVKIDIDRNQKWCGSLVAQHEKSKVLYVNERSP